MNTLQKMFGGWTYSDLEKKRIPITTNSRSNSRTNSRSNSRSNSRTNSKSKRNLKKGKGKSTTKVNKRRKRTQSMKSNY